MQFVVRQGHAAGCACSGQTDDVLGADVGGENRGADNPPAKIASGEEIVRGGILGAADHPPGNAKQDGEIDADHYPVDGGEACLQRACEQQSGRDGHLDILVEKLGGSSFSL